MVEPISAILLYTTFTLAVLGTGAREVVGLAKTAIVNIVYRKENKLKKLISRKDELVKRDIECERWKEMREVDWGGQKNNMSDVKEEYCDKARKEMEKKLIEIMDMEKKYY